MATKSKKRTTSAKAPSPMTVKIAGTGGKKRTYKKKTCHTSKGAAKASATGFRERGSTARVIQNGKVFCVYVGPKAKAPFGGKRRRKKAA